ncbi:NAD+ synthase (glutamine-hydrolyzing) [Dysgonomonadaceae bacterium PH5-43]|nr:NAD+ synthase (glutamine-hydrolyzing) [Dysgonomonadaceae bacterium PH5-43]
MVDYGFYRVASAIPEVKVGDCSFNVERIKELVCEASNQNVGIVCFPELSLTGYSCGDLFLQHNLIEETQKVLKYLLNETKALETIFIVGAPVLVNSKLYNCAIICAKGEVLGIVPKKHLPNYSEFYEKRWFQSYDSDENTSIYYLGSKVFFGNHLLFGSVETEKLFAVEVCEDLWATIPPSSNHSLAGAKLIFNLSASNELAGKQQYTKSLLAQQSSRCLSAYVYASAGFGESTTDTVFAGNGYVYENGKLLAESKRFEIESQLVVSEIDWDLIASERLKNTSFATQPMSFVEVEGRQIVSVCLSNKTAKDKSLIRKINPTPFIPSADDYKERCEEIFSIQVMGLVKRIKHINCKSLIIGVSGGLDSTLALLVCAKAVDKLGLPRTMICGVTMPGFGTSDRTYSNAIDLMKSLGISTKEIDITAACMLHFKDIEHDPNVHDVTYENTQARERTQILMDLSNKLNGIVVGTGDLSELALGWATYNGDHISMYGVNAGVPKTLVRHLVKWIADNRVDEASRNTLNDIIDTPISPELLPVNKTKEIAQKTEDLVGPYELHDFFLYYMLRYGFKPEKIFFLAKQAFEGVYTEEVVKKWIKVFYSRFFSQQFKRNCMPDGPKVGSVNLSPRGDWRMPSDASVSDWLNKIS